MPGPFLCYYKTCSWDDLQAAQDLLQEIIDEEGPFDGVFAFSQGASLTISYLLELERQKPGVNQPFNFAVLFSPIMPLSPDPAFCAEEIENLTKADYDFFAQVVNEVSGEHDAVASSSTQGKYPDFINPALCTHQPDLETRKQILVSSIGGILRHGIKANFLSASEVQAYMVQHDKSLDNSSISRAFHPSLMDERIRIPTVYVTGSKDDDDLLAQFKAMPFFCKKSLVREVVHSGGHDLPRAPNEVKKVIKAIEWALEEGKMPLF
jgi:hypothetical protein